MRHFIIILIAILFFVGCATARVDKIPSYVQLTAADLEFGPVLEAEMPYNQFNPNAFDEVKSKALGTSKWDMLILERYIITPFKIKVIGRGARIKN